MGWSMGKKKFNKSDLRESKVGINPNTAYEWFKIVQFCQKEMPEIEVKEVGRNVYIEVINNKKILLQIAGEE